LHYGKIIRNIFIAPVKAGAKPEAAAGKIDVKDEKKDGKKADGSDGNM